MKLADPIQYSTPGAPILIANAADAAHWNGAESDGTGVVVHYWGDNVEKLPKQFSDPARKKGEAAVKFATAAEADRFAAEVVKHFKKLHPKAARPPEYPDYPAFYIGDERVFVVEQKFTSSLDVVSAKLKADAATVVFDKKQKAQGLFFQIEGDGSGLIAADDSSTALVVANVTTADTDDYGAMVSALGKTSPTKLKAKGKIQLAGETIIVDAGQSARQIAERNWKTTDFLAGVAKALKSKTQSPVLIEGQKVPGGGCFRVEPGTYSYTVVHDVRAPKLVFDALWLWKS